jgi:hypothetical protein
MLSAAGRFSSRTLLIWGLALIVALWLAMTAIGGIAQAGAPGVALSVFPQSGFAYETRAADHALTAGGSIQKMRMSGADLADAREALRREPFATTALTLIGIATGQHGDAVQATRMVAAAHALNKRQLLANAWLINRYGTTGRDREVLALLDEALKVSPQLTVRYMPAFAQALQNPETIPAFQVLLNNHPMWEKDFWSAVAGTPASLPNAEVLRGRILAGRENLGPIDTQLTAAFIAAGRVDLALSYAKSLPPVADDHDSLVRNASFSYIPVLPPLDWELFSDGRISGAIDESRGTLEISALPGSSGTVARQLIALAPGNYALLVKLGQAELARGAEISVHLHCAERADSTASLTERLTGDLDRSFVVPDGGCRFFWIDLDFSAMDSSEPALGSIAEIRIARGRALL